MTSGGPHALLKGFRDSYNITHKHGVFTGTTTHLKTEHALPIAPPAHSFHDQRPQCGCGMERGRKGWREWTDGGDGCGLELSIRL